MGAKQKAVLSKDIRSVSASITRPSNATQYTAGDAISAVTTDDHFSFVDVVDSALSGTIDTLTISTSDSDVTSKTLELHLFRDDFTDVADHAAFTVTDTEVLSFIGTINIPAADWKAFALNSVCTVSNIGLDFRLGGTTSGSRRDLYAQLVAADTYTPASAEVFNIELLIARH